MQPPSGSVPTLPMPPFLTSVSPTSTVHGIKANWADFFWFIFWLQASLHHQLLNVLISLFKLSQAVQAKQKIACLLAGRSARFLPAQFTILFGDLKVCYTIVSIQFTFISGGFIKVGVWVQDENASSLQISRDAIKRSNEQSRKYLRPSLNADTLIVVSFCTSHVWNFIVLQKDHDRCYSPVLAAPFY